APGFAGQNEAWTMRFGARRPVVLGPTLELLLDEPEPVPRREAFRPAPELPARRHAAAVHDAGLPGPGGGGEIRGDVPGVSAPRFRVLKEPSVARNSVTDGIEIEIEHPRIELARDTLEDRLDQPTHDA